MPRVETAGWVIRFDGEVTASRGRDISAEFRASTQADDAAVVGLGTAECVLTVGEERFWVGRASLPAQESPLIWALSVLATRAGGLLVHSAAVSARGRGVLAVGPSGSGKSTFATLLQHLELLSDEFNVIRPSASGLVLASTPLRSSSPREPKNRVLPLGVLLFLKKAHVDQLAPVSPLDAVRRLAAQVVLPEGTTLRPSLSTLASVANTIPAYEFHFRKDPACRRLLDEIP